MTHTTPLGATTRWRAWPTPSAKTVAQKPGGSVRPPLSAVHTTFGARPGARCAASAHHQPPPSRRPIASNAAPRHRHRSRIALPQTKNRLVVWDGDGESGGDRPRSFPQECDTAEPSILCGRRIAGRGYASLGRRGADALPARPIERARPIELEHDVGLDHLMVGHAEEGVAPANQRGRRSLRRAERDAIPVADDGAGPLAALDEIVRARTGRDGRGVGAVVVNLENAQSFRDIENASDLREGAPPSSTQIARRGPGRARRNRAADEDRQSGQDPDAGALLHD